MIMKEFELKEGMALEEHEDELALTPNDASEIDKFNAFLDALKTNMFWQLKTREEQCMLMKKCYDGVYGNDIKSTR